MSDCAFSSLSEVLFQRCFTLRHPVPRISQTKRRLPNTGASLGLGLWRCLLHRAQARGEDLKRHRLEAEQSRAERRGQEAICLTLQLMRLSQFLMVRKASPPPVPMPWHPTLQRLLLLRITCVCTNPCDSVTGSFLNLEPSSSPDYTDLCSRARPSSG